MKKFLAILLSTVLMLSLPTTVFAATVTVTVNQSGHTYEAYQILTGSQGDSETALGDVVWGSGINSSAFLAALKADETVKDIFKDANDAKSFAEAMATLTDNSAEANAVAAIVDANKIAAEAIALTAGENQLADGYYLIVDTTDLTDEYDSKNASLLQVTRDITIANKSAKPEVDKQVQDEVDDKDIDSTDTVDGWGETADHAINESFKFKLIATLPADSDFAAYETYTVVFTDTMSDGITFESIASVHVNTKEVPLHNATTAPNGYTYTAVAGQEGGSWTLTIEDIMEYDDNLADGATITVIYNAHLNDDAKIADGNDDDDDNKNTVYLKYSNNPNVEGGNELGKTPEDTVWVFTYKVDSTKYKNENKTGNELPGAGFTLYTSTDGKTKGDAVKLVLDSSKKAYRPASEAEIAEDANKSAEQKIVVTEMTSAADGKFNVIGLDVGTYIMEETNVPAGYNKCDDIVIEITTAHAENETSAATNIEMKIDEEVATINTVVNKAGSTLPETGGIGTTIFYAVGGVMVAAAAILLITKKRMSTEG